jgi:ATP-dependent exoDNAse (exonuclease V) beta subunit
VLVDYKTDKNIDQGMDHYLEQLSGYRALLEQTTGLPVTKTSLLHLTETEASEISLWG